MELRGALETLGLAPSETAVRNVMLELDEDGGGTLEVAEVTMIVPQ